MSFHLSGFRWRIAIGFIAVCCLLVWLSGRWMQGRGAAAEVYGRLITTLELEEALRAHLWQHHESWAAIGAEARQQTRWLVLENLVNDRLIRAHRLMDGLNVDLPSAAVRRESDMMQRQFADAAEYPLRLAAQQQTQHSLDAAIREAQRDEQWIAAKIARRLAEVTDQDLRAWYDAFKETLRIQQAHHAAHLFLTRHDQAKPDREPEMREIHRQLMAREQTFAALAAVHSDDDRTKAMGGDLGWFTRERMPQDFIVAVEKLKIGQFSDPVPTQLGWHLIIVMDRRASRLPTVEEAKDEIAALLTSRRREDAVQNLIAELRERSLRPVPSVFYHPQVIDHTEPAP